jgi:tetratricopeptide (TPR) repeat protein/WD40 repeat protein/serine/threonine protein kinase
MNEREIFDAALQIPGEEARAAYLRRACGHDDALREQIEGLLRAERQLGSFLAAPLPAFAPTLTEPTLLEKPGTQIGPYKLLEQIGEGGFGIVFMAEQQHPVRRKVALKVLKPGMDTRQVIARFEAERQALALMDHPYIAKVLDAGATDTGRPYFVMELVKGVPVTEYCDAHQLTPRERLELFVAVCQAVQHAHQKGIIHRDIKPSNVLVTEHDGTPVVKVIDFGVAKAMGQQLTDKTLFTGFAQMIGTPLYMSPEQAQLSGLDIDTRTDIYSLGVLLYELLTGTTPFDKERLKSAAFDEIRRMIREEEPPKPSTRLSSLSSRHAPRAVAPDGAPSVPTTSLASIAALRKTEPRKLSQLVRGDLDWIVMKALEKDRNRRYETASGFALDIQRYLADEPVAACPPSVVYRLRKFARRNKAGFIIATTLAAALVIAVVGLSVSNTLVRRESREKEQALKDKGLALEARERALTTARYQEGVAKENAAAAEKERNNAAANEKEAKLQEKLARRLFYASQMNLAQQALDEGNTARVLELLENHRPRFDEDDLRGFEWYYLWGKCHGGLRTWLKTDSPTNAVAFAPDNRTIAVAGNDGAVTLSDAQTGAVLGRLVQHDSLPQGLAFSPDRKTLAVATTSGIELWDWTQHKFLGTLGHGISMAQAAFFPDGRRLASVRVTWERPISIWDVERREVETTPGEMRAICVAIAPDGMTLAAGENRSVSVWRCEGKSWTRLRNHANIYHEVRSIAFSPDGALLVSANSHHAADHSRVERVEPGDPGAVRPENGDLSGDGPPSAPERPAPREPLRSGVHVWDVATGEERVALKGRGVVGWVGTIAFAPDSRLLAVSNHGTVLFYDLASGLPQITVYGSPTHTHTISQVQFSPDGRYLATAAVNENDIKIWDRSVPAPVETLNVGGSSNFVSFSTDEQTVLAGSTTVKFWDLPTGREVRSWVIGEGEQVLSSPSPDGRLVATHHPDLLVRVRELATGELVARMAPNSREVYKVAFSPDGRALAIPTSGQGLMVWDIHGQNPVFSAPSWTYVAGYSPDGERVAFGDWDGKAHLFNPRTGQFLRSIATGSSWSIAVAFAPASRLLATANRDGTVAFWDPRDGTLKGTLGGHGDVVTSMSFLADGQTLVTGTEDGAVKLWDMATRQELFTFHNHRSTVNCAVVTRDGSVLATNSVDGHVRLHHAQRPREATAPRTELDPGDPLSPARQLDAADQFWAAGRSADGLSACETARLRVQTLVERFPAAPQHRCELARSWLVASLIDASPETTRASTHTLQHAVDMYRRLPVDLQKSLLQTYLDLGDELHTRGENERAEQLYAHLVVLFEQLATAEPKAVAYRVRAAHAEGRLAGVFGKAKRLPEALAACDRARGRLEKLREEFAHNELRLSELADAWSLLGSVLQSCQKLPEAIAAFSRAIEIQPDKPSVWWDRADAHRIANQHEEAILDYGKYLELDPGEWAAWNDRGVCHSRLGRFEMAAADFSRAAEWGKVTPRHNLAIVHGNLGQLDLALADYSTAIEANPSSAALRIARAQILASSGRRAEAIADYRKAVELQPNDAITVMSLGSMFLLSGKKDEAVAWYRKAVELTPGSVAAHHALARALFELGKFDEARACFRKALELDPKRAYLHSNLGDVLAKQGADDESVAFYQRALELDPDFALAHSGLGAVSLHQGRLDDAVASFKKALKLNPDLAQAHNGLGRALFGLGQWDEAAVSFKRALELDPDNATASKSLGDALFKSSRFGEAVATYRRAIELNPADWEKFVDSYQKSGPIAENQEKFGPFVTACRKLAEVNPASPQLVLELARLLTSAGRVPATLALWEELVDSSSGNQDFRLRLGHKLWEVADQSSAASRHDQAENALRSALLVLEKLTADFPGNPFYRFEHGFSQWKLGWLMFALNRPEDAEEPFRRALAIYRRLAEDDPTNLEYRLRLARSYNELAIALARQGKHAEANVEWDNAAAESTKALDLKPDAWEAWSGRAFVHFHRLQCEEAIVDFSKAIELAPQVHTNWWHRGHCYLNLAQWDKAAANFGKVVEQWPEGGEGWYLRAVALANLNQPENAMADLREAIRKGFTGAEQMKTDSRLNPLRAREDFSELLGKFERRHQFAHNGRWATAIADYTNTELMPLDVAARRARAQAHNILAWLLATCPDAALRDPRRAVALATEAVELQPNQGMYWNTLGAAHCRAGDWAAAIEALNESMELRQGGDAFDWFFLAMAEWRRGNKDEARRWYDKAAEWRAQKGEGNEELQRFEAEAKDVLEGKKNEDGK